MRKNLVFTAFQRPGYLAKSLLSWGDAERINHWDVYSRIEPSKYQSTVVDLFEELLGFRAKSAATYINSERLGVLRNPWATLDCSFQRGSEFTVLAEDDVVVSRDVLEYFEWAMEFYREDKNVLAVLAFSKLPALEEGALDSFYQSNVVTQTSGFCPLVWGTWNDRWEEHISPNWDFDYSSGNPDGSQAGWDWNMSRLAKKTGKHFVFPVLSRSDHIGEFEGTHMIPSDFKSSQAPTFKKDHGRKENFRDWSKK